jgi:hypothetical protein
MSIIKTSVGQIYIDCKKSAGMWEKSYNKHLVIIIIIIIINWQDYQCSREEK